MPESRADVVDAELAAYIAAHSTKPDEVQRRLMDVTVERTGGAARMQIGGDQGTFFEILVSSMGATRAIEVGTFTGYSAMSIARGLGPSGRLLCLDVSDEWTAIGREHWDLAGVGDRIELRLGPALDSLAALGPGDVFDVAFIDADKGNYARYYEALLPHIRRGGVILVDNTLWSRQVLDVDASEHDTVALQSFNRMVADDPRVRCVVVPMGDGVTVIQVIS